MEILVELSIWIGGLMAATYGVATFRQRRAEADYPPTGAFLDMGGLRLHYRQAGQGPDVVVLHGASGSVREFDFGLLERLAIRYRVTAFDRPGLGWSDALPVGEDGLADQARLLANACDALGIARPLVVGQSYGGSVALAWGLSDRAPVALVLIGAPCVPWPGDLDIWYRLNRPRLGRWLMPRLAAAWIWPGYIRASLTGIFAPDPLPPGYATHIGTGLTIRRKTLVANVAQVNALRPALVAMQGDYPRLTLPIESLHGETDKVVPFAVHARAFAALAPVCQLTALPATGHMPHHSRLAEVMAAIDRAHSRANMNKTGGPHGSAL